jgi:glyoxylase-like metal-dependent hydrolase (beta-lactamase superfamily II)
MPSAGTRIIIDPVDTQLARDLEALRDYGLKLVWALETHAHADHITSAGQLAELAGAKTTAPAACGVSSASVLLKDGDELQFGSESIRALHTPGHTSGSMCFVWRDHVFTGDTLLINGCGRTDLASGSTADLYHSLTEVLFKLPDTTIVWPGHDYQGRSHSSIGAGKVGNASYVPGKTLAEFGAIMDALHLPSPQAHRRGQPRANLHLGLRHDAPAPRRWCNVRHRWLCRRHLGHTGAPVVAGRDRPCWWMCEPMPSAPGSALYPSAVHDCLETVARHGDEPHFDEGLAGSGTQGQKAAAAVPQRRALGGCGQTRHRTGAASLQHSGRF